jgi:hypothetical protein
MLVLAARPVWASAGAEFDLALVEMLLELCPFFVGRRAVFFGRAHRAAPVEKFLHMPDNIVFEHRDVSLRSLQAHMTEQRCSNVNRKPIVDQIPHEQSPKIVWGEMQSSEFWVCFTDDPALLAEVVQDSAGAGD